MTGFECESMGPLCESSGRFDSGERSGICFMKRYKLNTYAVFRFERNTLSASGHRFRCNVL